MTAGARTENAVVIEAPLEEVWKVTNDVPSWTWLYDEYAGAEVLEQSENYVKFRLTTHPDENGQQWSWVSERRLDPVAHVVHAKRTETGPFEFMHIRWEYTELPTGATEMRWIQHFHMKPVAPVDDDTMATRINTNSPIQMARIKRYLETGDTEAKDS